MFKLSTSAADFFIPIVRDIQEKVEAGNMSILQLQQAQHNFSTDTYGETTNMGSSTDCFDFLLQQGNARIDPELIKENKLIENAMWIASIRFNGFDVQQYLNRQDLQIQADFKQGLVVSFIDDRKEIVPLAELKMPTMMVQGNFEKLTLVNNFVITATLQCDMYSSRVMDWEPLIEEVVFTFRVCNNNI